MKTQPFGPKDLWLPSITADSQKKRVLVTGGTGFVGHWLKQTQPEDLDATYISSLDYRLWYWWKMDWDYIIHAAPVYPELEIKCALKHKTRLLYISSGIIYQDGNESDYRKYKLHSEQLCRIAHDLDYSIARLFTFYGDKLTDDHAIAAWQKAAESGQPIRIWGDGKAIRSYMHGSEMAEWLWAILLKGERGEAYDVGSDVPITLLELANSFASRYDVPVIVENSKPDPMPVYLPENTEKTMKLLGSDNMIQVAIAEESYPKIKRVSNELLKRINK